jgi:hypothetical protein
VTHDATQGRARWPIGARAVLGDVLAALALALAVFAVSRAYALPLVGLHHDDGQYVVAAKALATGAGYRQLQDPASPPQAKFPVLFPLVLSAAWLAAPSLPDAAAIMSRLCSASLGVAGAIVYLAARRRFRLPARAAAPLVLAGFTLPALAGLGAQVMSEPLFLLLASAGLALAAGADVRTRDWWLAGLAVGLAALTRSIGVSIVAGLLAWCVWRRRWPVGLVVPMLALPAAWFAWSVTSGATPTPADPLGYGADYRGWLRTVPVDAWPVVLRDNLLAVFVHGGHLVAQSGLWMAPAACRPYAALLVGIAVMALVAWGAYRVGGAWTWALACYLAMTVAWPWPPSRFLVVVLPLALVLPWAAVGGRRTTRTGLSVVAAVLAAANIGYAAASWSTARAAQGLVVTPGAPAPWREYEALFDWIRRSTPPGAVVVSVAEPMVYLYAGRSGVFPFAQRTIALNYSNPSSIGDDKDLDALLTAARATHLVRMPAPAWAHGAELDDVIARLRARRPGRLQRAYVGADARFEAFAVSAGGPFE